MTKVYSIQEAMNWFLAHSSGSVICVRDGQEQVCTSYPEAEAFYKS